MAGPAAGSDGALLGPGAPGRTWGVGRAGSAPRDGDGAPFVESRGEAGGYRAPRFTWGGLDVAFTRGGARELDRLGLFLNGMLGRIREGVARVRDAEKRATLGELARQVNHDVRNGLIPIRNVMRHLDESASDRFRRVVGDVRSEGRHRDREPRLSG